MACKLTKDFSNLLNYKQKGNVWNSCQVIEHRPRRSSHVYHMHHMCMCSWQLYGSLVKSRNIREASDRHKTYSAENITTLLLCRR